MKVSVVIPISSAEYIARLRACLNSVLQQTYPSDKIEILVTLLTPRSTASSAKGLKPFCEKHGATLIRHVHGEGAWPPSLSRNVGYRQATGDILVSLDADGVLDKRTFASAVARMEERKCAVRVRTSLTPRAPGAPVFFQLGRERFRRTVDLGRKAPGPGCCILAPREAVWAIHGWDEKFVGYGPADWDFVGRLEKAGWPVVNLSKTDEVWTLHQEHKRILGTPRQDRNRAYYEKSKLKRSPVRNLDGWGGGDG